MSAPEARNLARDLASQSVYNKNKHTLYVTYSTAGYVPNFDDLVSLRQRPGTTWPDRAFTKYMPFNPLDAIGIKQKLSVNVQTCSNADLIMHQSLLFSVPAPPQTRDLPMQSAYNNIIIGKRERANLVVRLSRFFFIYIVMPWCPPSQYI